MPRIAQYHNIAAWIRFLQLTQVQAYRHIVLHASVSARDFVNNLGQTIIATAHIATQDVTAAVEDVQGTAHVGQPTDRDAASSDQDATERPSGISAILLEPNAPNEGLTPEEDANIILEAASTSLQA